MTGFDGTKRDGDLGNLFSFKKNLGLFVLPKLINRKLKRVVIAQEYEFNRGNYNINLLVGDNFSKLGGKEMPIFRRRGTFK